MCLIIFVMFFLLLFLFKIKLCLFKVYLNIAGFQVNLYDTAGIRESEDAIEKEGVKRSMYYHYLYLEF